MAMRLHHRSVSIGRVALRGCLYGSQPYYYSEISDKGPSEKRTASLERTAHSVPINTFLDLREEDSLSIVEEEMIFNSEVPLYFQLL